MWRDMQNPREVDIPLIGYNMRRSEALVRGASHGVLARATILCLTLILLLQ
jgi:hypothetical protein